MTERQWSVDIERCKLTSNDGFYYKVTKAANDSKLTIECIGHPMLSASELDLVREIAAEAYSAYIEYLKDLH